MPTSGRPRTATPRLSWSITLAVVLLSGCRTTPSSRPTTDDCIPGDSGPSQPLVTSITDSLPPGTLLVNVRDRLTGAALDAAVLRLASPVRRASTDARGDSRFDSLHPGQYVVTTRRIGYDARTDTVSVGNVADQRVQMSLRRPAMCLRSVVFVGLPKVAR